MKSIIIACVLTALAFMSLISPDNSEAAVTQVLSGLDQPVRLVAPEGDPRLFVVERSGLIRVFDQQGLELGTFLNISAQTSTFSERGLLGLAFAPDYALTGRFYINFTDLQGDTRIARYTVSEENENLADPSSQEIILTVDQPYANHNGGHLEFGPDNMLYIGLGDGGSSGDPQNRAQNDQVLLGKMLRLDVDVPVGYEIPADNPFVGLAPRDEIWAKGLRNPWCYSFDQATDDLYIADVGQGSEEEVDVQPALSEGGENYGWRLMEGNLCYSPPTDCNDGSLTLPIHTYTRGGSPFRCAISGGYVYRGASLPSLTGKYFFADYCSNQIWSLTWTQVGGVGGVVEHTAEMTPPGGYGSVASFGQDGLGELYIMDIDRGRAYRIVSSSSSVPEVQNSLFLAQNTPNPFNPRTQIAFGVNTTGAHVSLVVFDVAGRRVRTLVDEILPPGDHVVTWNGTNESGGKAESGVYLYLLELNGRAVSRKMILLE
jgi:glucose/arabinose dehydrogenase